MTEIERESILAQRIEERQKVVDKRNLDQMLREQGGHGDPDNVASAAKRIVLTSLTLGLCWLILRGLQVNMLREVPLKKRHASWMS